MVMQQSVIAANDDLHIIKSLAFVLNNEGDNIQTMTNFDDALEKIKESKLNLMFLDVVMPGKNGYEICQDVKGSFNLSDVYILKLTARYQEADSQPYSYGNENGSIMRRMKIVWGDRRYELCLSKRT